MPYSPDSETNAVGPAEASVVYTVVDRRDSVSEKVKTEQVGVIRMEWT